eukprot:GFUD01092267.1.p1 GENE.GFUD01092267.1~~GFUD01092267.1.p1  ORF type:complete len:180 (+),score=34.99 GFUD01092267.1:65-541(+)
MSDRRKTPKRPPSIVKGNQLKMPQSIVKANQQVDAALGYNKDCYTCLNACNQCLRQCRLPRIADDVESYADVQITNILNVTVTGTVFYLWWGDDNNFKIPAGESSVPMSRGLKLIYKITARRENGKKSCIPYESTGTSYSQFKVENLGKFPGCVVVSI